MGCKLLLRVLLSLAAMLVFSAIVSAQKISNVDANQEGKMIAITYDLNEAANISVFVSYDAGQTKTALPLEYISGDWGKRINAGNGKKILWRVLDQFPNQNFQGENMSFIVEARPVMHFFTMANVGYSLDSGMNAGITIGQVGSWGWYAKAVSTLSLPKDAQLECDKNGAVSGVYPAYSGYGNKFKAYGLGGVNIRLGAPVYLYAGAGYGIRYFDWETVDGKWVRYAPGSYSGVAIDGGIMARFNSVIISAGVTYLEGSIDIGFGFGWAF